MLILCLYYHEALCLGTTSVIHFGLFQPPGLVQATPAHGRRDGPRWSSRSVPTQDILIFYYSLPFPWRNLGAFLFGCAAFFPLWRKADTLPSGGSTSWHGCTSHAGARKVQDPREIFLLHAYSGPSGPILVTFAESPLSREDLYSSDIEELNKGEKKTYMLPCKSHVLLANSSKLARLSSLEPCHLSHQRHFVRTSNMCTPDAGNSEQL